MDALSCTTDKHTEHTKHSKSGKSSSLVELVIGHRILHQRRLWARLLLPRRHKLTRIKARSILDLLVVLVWVEDYPLLPCLLRSYSASASHAHSNAPAGKMFVQRSVRLCVRPSATRLMTPEAQILTVFPSFL